MTSGHVASENLFSYGTLQEESVQVATFGRKLDGRPDKLVGYRVTLVPIADQVTAKRLGTTHHRNAQFTGVAFDTVEGTVFNVSINELLYADEYEAGANYKRLAVHLESGVSAWVYVLAES